jgi:iron complex transport system permease protein
MRKHGDTILFAFMLLALPALLLAGLATGGEYINPADYFRDGDTLFSKSLLELRFLRLATAFAVGGALAVSGVAYQAVLRNPLAEPFILGISGGASLGAAVAIGAKLAASSPLAIPACSFVGASLVLLAVLSVSRGTGAEYATHIMLSGVIAGTVCSSALMFMISVMDLETLHSVTWWMLGSLTPEGGTLLAVTLGVGIAGAALLFLFGRDADALSMGSETAFHLGVSPRFSGLVILGTASLLTAAAVSLSGVIGFVGLIVPHILRKLFGAGHRRLFPAAYLAGGMFLMLCDILARTALYPKEIPVGVVTAALGGPFFIWLVNRRKGG